MTVPYTFANKTGTISLAELDANFETLDTAVPAVALSAGTVTQGTQANITSVGTLNSLTVAGFVTGGTITGTQLIGTIATSSQPNITQIGDLTTLTVTNVFTAGSILTTTIAGQLTTASQPSITALGTLTSLSVTGNVNSSNISASSITGTLQTSSQPNVTSLGTLTSLAVTGNISGTLSTPAQPNITSLGTLSSLSVSGSATAATAANSTSNTQLATTAFVSNSLLNVLPSGVIVLWSGSIASVPQGWVLCDGGSGTPDLRDRFIVGAGTTYTPGNTGGSSDAIVVSHTHTAASAVTDPGHRHTYNAPSGTDDGGFSGSVVDNIVSANTGNATTGITVATTISSTGNSGTNANLPPYYALAYIMKA